MNRRNSGTATANKSKSKESYIAVPEAPIETLKSPMDIVVEIETARLQLGIKKNVLCKMAGVKAEMYSYVLRRGRDRQSLPAECVEKIQRALRRLKNKVAAAAERERIQQENWNKQL